MKAANVTTPSPVSGSVLHHPLKRGLSQSPSSTLKRPCQVRTNATLVADDADNISPDDQVSSDVQSREENRPSTGDDGKLSPCLRSPAGSRGPPPCDATSTPVNTGQLRADKSMPSSVEELGHKRARLQCSVAAKEQTLNNLKLVKLHQSKNDIDTLKFLTSKWRSVVQNVVVELHDAVPEPRPSLAEFVDYVRVDRELIGFDPDDESFN